MAEDNENMKLTVKMVNGQTFEVAIEMNATVEDLRLKIAEQSSIPVEQQRIIFAGRILKDGQTLSEYKVQDGSAIHLVKAASSQQRSKSTSSSQSSSVTPPSTSQSSSFSSSNPSTQSPATSNPLGMTSDMMDQMMNSPLMDHVMSDPNIFRSMMTSNPQIQQLMEQQPQLRAALNDDATLRQMMQTMRNPALRQEMMRQQDRMMSNVEAMPGGFNFLSSMFSDVQQPMMDALDPSNRESNRIPIEQNPFIEILAPAPGEESGMNTDALPNPWASPSSGSSSSNPSSASMMMPPGMPGMPPGMDMDQMVAMMESPMFQQQLDMISSNPQMLDMVLNMNPMLRDNPALREQQRQILTNPDLRRQMMNPQSLRNAMQMQQALQGMMGNQQEGQDNNNTDMNTLMQQMMQSMPPGMMNFGGAPSTPSTPQSSQQSQQSPRERFAVQMETMRGMGFTDDERNLQALTRANGNVQLAISFLLGD